MPGREETVRVTVTLPASLYERIKASTDNFSAFVAEALARRLRNVDFDEALAQSAGAMGEAFAGLRRPEGVTDYLPPERAGWKPDGE